MERDLRLAQWADERERHSLCGFRYSECGDPNTTFYPYLRVDYAEMERAGSEGLYAALHADEPYHDGTFTKWAKERSREFPFHYSDGVTVGVALTDLAPWHHFTTRVDASPIPPDATSTEAVTDGDSS